MTKQKGINFYIQLFYGIGVSYAIVDQVFNQWVLYYYLPPNDVGLKPLLAPLYISIALAISRLVDMVADPLIGWWSDRVDTRFGKRIPFIALGTIPLVLATIAYFYPVKSDGNIPTFLYLTATGCIFFIFYTIVGAPYNALIPEIGRSADDRLNLSTAQSVFRLIYSALAMILPGILIETLGGGNTEHGIRMMAVILGVISIGGLAVTVFLVPEKKLAITSSAGETREKISLAKSGFDMKSLAFYLVGLLFFFFGFNILRATTNYYVENIMGMGKMQITIASGLFVLGCFASFYPVNKLARKYGCRLLMLGGLLMMIVISLLLFGLGRVLPIWSGFVIFFLMGIPVAGTAFIFPPAMLSNLATRAREKSGKNVGGILFGIQGFFLKTAFFLQIAVLPVVLVMQRGTSLLDSLISKPDGIQTSGIYMTSIIAAVSFAVSFLFYFLYKEERSQD
jgi:GPH family glycoside/pentoside/hexuronide:cation symporter